MFIPRRNIWRKRMEVWAKVVSERTNKFLRRFDPLPLFYCFNEIFGNLVFRKIMRVAKFHPHVCSVMMAHSEM